MVKREKCDACGTDLYDEELKSNMIAEIITLAPYRAGVEHSQIKRVRAFFGKTKFTICWVCRLKGLGLRPKKK